MEYLRWILLAAGIAFILLVYLLGRNRRRQNNHVDIDTRHEVPEFSAQDWDDLDEGVGEVRIVARDTADDYTDDEPGYDEEVHDTTTAIADDDYASQLDADTDDRVKAPEEEPKRSGASSDIIVLYILARPEQKFAGDKINSAAKACGLIFGDMNIYHRLDDDDLSVFGLANMVEPGSFDPAVMRDLRTPGLTLFLQISEVVDAEAAFDDMMHCAYRMTEMLDGQLCNRRRQPLTQSDAEQYRELVTGIDA